ncbi:MAG: hypothetical protein M1158_02060 [Candidatus Marsarchaeota archaeon]|nr:hypothetical protein [Candidatus Marsarchaeota archaeon]
MNRKIFVATTNEGKLKEFREAFGGSGIEIEPLSIKFNELQQDDLQKVSQQKALDAFGQIKKPILVDDSGIYIDRYNNFPGTNTKQIIEGLGIEGIKRLIDEGDRAHFFTILSYMDESSDVPVTFTGEAYGRLSLKYNGGGETGFPFNQLFIPDGDSRFVCEIPVGERIKFSHRMKAASKFKEYILTK